MPKDNRISDRTPQQIAASRQAALHGKVLKAFIRTNAFDEALDMFRKIISCPDARQSTKNEAAKAIMQATIKMLPQSPHVQVDARQQTLNMADLLALSQEHVQDAPELPNGEPVVSSELQAGLLAPNDAQSSDSRSPQPGVAETDAACPEQPDSTEGSSLASVSGTPAGATPSDERKEDTTETLGDTAPPSDTPELDDLLGELDGGQR